MIIDATSDSVLNTSGDVPVRVGVHNRHRTNLDSLQQEIKMIPHGPSDDDFELQWMFLE
jgi:hypothetical protein